MSEKWGITAQLAKSLSEIMKSSGNRSDDYKTFEYMKYQRITVKYN